MSMDMKVSGSGMIPPGEYNEVRTSGSSKLKGLVQCKTFHSSGSCKGEDLLCEQTCKTSGSVSFSGNITAEVIHTSGSFSCQGNITATTLHHSGSFRCGGNMKCQQLHTSGSLKAEGGIEAENICVNGVVHCHDLINAESIKIHFFEGMKIGSVGGSNITFTSHKKFLKFIIKKSNAGKILVANAIEGDQINIEYTHCPLVTGRNVTIRKGCKIDLVQYTDSVEIHPDAKVEKVEKI